jgi:dimeric dUTPase (all-alpha-NTP-PPase superfamily)
MPDMLDRIFEGQRELMERYHEIEEVNGSPVIFQEEEGDLDSRHVQARLHEVYGYLSRELAEAMAELKNKPWKQTERPTDRQAFVNEVGDTLHFFIEFCITAGISAEELHDSYFRMHKKNQHRQNTDY